MPVRIHRLREPIDPLFAALSLEDVKSYTAVRPVPSPHRKVGGI